MKQVFFLLIFCIASPVLISAQQTDTAIVPKDSLAITSSTQVLIKHDSSVIIQNSLLNSTGIPVSLAVKYKKVRSGDAMFYLLTALVLLLAFFRFFFPRYFSNLFRVFFNTSLRQSQLTDQLLQAKLPSLFFNLFFIISGGLYIYFLLVYYHWVNLQNSWVVIGSCIGLLGFIYFFKFCTLKFTGWITGYKEETNTYVFILFLINKIMGIFLVPFIILMAFSDNIIVKTAVLISLGITGFLLLLRFFRSYGLLQNQLKVSRFHLLLYIVGLELLPLLLIYKGLVILLNKNL